MPAERERSRFRPELQALRAIAVALVVVYHLWPTRLTGGYIGVDIFFAISGFLITAHLLSEAVATGTVSLTTFWSRRIRRLLPAALVVLTASLIGALIWIPDSLIQQNLRDIGASSLYAVNWILAADATDYLRSESLPSIVQHYWSLSVEEQFYIVWPLLLVGSVFLARALARRRGSTVAIAITRVFAPVLIVVFVASLAYSVILSVTSPALAYFSTFTRAWEFAAGALLAVAVSRWPLLGLDVRRVRSVIGVSASVVGLGLIAVAAVLFDASTPFPGWLAAVPISGAILVIAGTGLLSGSSLLIRLASLAPLQRTGDWSYAIYLWHWPLIALYPFVFGAVLSGWHALAIIALSVVLAAATKYLIEDPVRRGRRWGRRRWPAFALASAGAAVLILVSSTYSLGIDSRKAEAQQFALQQLNSDAPCFGAGAMDTSAQCPNRFVLSASTDLAFAAGDLDPDWCLATESGPLLRCEYGETKSPTKVIALVGDSHAAALVPAFDLLGAEQGWKVVTYLRSGCPALSVDPIQMPNRPDAEEEACAQWSTEVLDELDHDPDIDSVVFTNFSSRYADAAVPQSERLDSETVSQTFQRVLDSGKQVAVIRDVPDTHRVNIPNCLGTSILRSGPCSFPRAEGLVDDVMQEATRATPGVSSIDLSGYFCDDETCYAVIGDVVVYADESHVSDTYARTLAPYIGRELQNVIR